MRVILQTSVTRFKAYFFRFNAKETDVFYNLCNGEVSELVDEHDLGSCAARRGSSSLPFPMYKNPLTGF